MEPCGLGTICSCAFLSISITTSRGVRFADQVVLKEPVILISFEREVNLNTALGLDLEEYYLALTVFIWA